MTIKNQLLKFKQTVSQLTMLPLIEEIDLKIIERLESESNENDYAREICKKIRPLLRDLSIENLDAQRGLHNAFVEARLYYELKRKVDIERNPEGNGSQPDFCIMFNGERFFAEVKAVSMAGSNQNYKNLIEEGLDAKIKIENQINEGHRISIAGTIIQPAFSGQEDYDPRSRHCVIECLIEKIRALIKPTQFQSGTTFLFVDLNQWALGSDTIRSLIPIYPEDETGTCGSGVLWYVAFGKAGNQIFKPAEFEGASNIDKLLSKDGILHEFADISGIFFCYPCGTRKNSRLLGLYRAYDENSTKNFVETVADLYNDDFNNNDFLLQKEYNSQFPGN